MPDSRSIAWLQRSRFRRFVAIAKRVLGLVLLVLEILKLVRELL